MSEVYLRVSLRKFSRSAPLKFFAIIRPDGSRIKEAGIPSTLYCVETLPSHSLSSDTCVQARLSSSIALTHAPLVLSRETPRTVKPLSLNELYCLTRLGFSWRHGAHHEA